MAPPPHGPLRPAREERSLTAAVTRALSARIDAAELRPGDRLPTERELMGAYGVSRTVVREAISGLRAEGLVVTHQGKGAFVTRDGARAAFRITEADVVTLQDVVRVMELRIGLEAEAAALAALRRTDAQLEPMRAALAEMEEAVEASDASVAADLRFHVALAEATGNGYFAELLRQLGPPLIPRARVDTFRHDPAARRAYLRRVNQEHEQILRAVEAHDADAARAAMRVHLVNGRERIRRAFDQAIGLP
jgi:GntR family transcriptional regulator, transcriptional repressor for pyruvate dehydrogenase complex